MTYYYYYYTCNIYRRHRHRVAAANFYRWSSEVINLATRRRSAVVRRLPRHTAVGLGAGRGAAKFFAAYIYGGVEVTCKCGNRESGGRVTVQAVGGWGVARTPVCTVGRVIYC